MKTGLTTMKTGSKSNENGVNYNEKILIVLF